MVGTCYAYITTKVRDGKTEILDAHRRLEYARKQLDDLETQAKTEGHRCMRTQAGCCLRTQRGDNVTYYEIIKRELK